MQGVLPQAPKTEKIMQDNEYVVWQELIQSVEEEIKQDQHDDIEAIKQSRAEKIKKLRYQHKQLRYKKRA